MCYVWRHVDFGRLAGPADDSLSFPLSWLLSSPLHSSPPHTHQSLDRTDFHYGIRSVDSFGSTISQPLLSFGPWLNYTPIPIRLALILLWIWRGTFYGVHGRHLALVQPPRPLHTVIYGCSQQLPPTQSFDLHRKTHALYYNKLRSRPNRLSVCKLHSYVIICWNLMLNTTCCQNHVTTILPQHR